MATVSKWTPFDVALDITATGGTVTRTSATQYTVKINASWETYYEGAKTNYGMSASSGGSSVNLNTFGTASSSGRGSFTGTYSISGNGSATKTITVTFRNFNTDNGNSATNAVTFDVTVPAWTSYTIRYNANGGTGAPASQIKWKNQALTLSTTKPTRTNYVFKGWGISASTTTVAYAPGANYTRNAAVTLYAVWELAYAKPRISNVSISRCDISGTPGDNGMNALVSFAWECDLTLQAITVGWKPANLDSWTESTLGVSDNSGEVSAVVGSDAISSDSTYDVRIMVEDTNGVSYVLRSLPGSKFPIDVLNEGKGISFGKPAELEGVADFGWAVRFSSGLLYPILEPETNLNDVVAAGMYVGENVSTYNYTNCPLASGTFTLEVMTSGSSGQTMQRITRCHKTNPIVYERFLYSGEWGAWVEYIPAIDSGWQYPEINSAFTAYGSLDANRVRYRKLGKTVEVRGVVSNVNDITDSVSVSYTIATLPDGYRPSSQISHVCQGSSTCVWLMRITEEGVIEFSRYRNGDTIATLTSGRWLPFHITYFVD